MLWRSVVGKLMDDHIISRFVCFDLLLFYFYSFFRTIKLKRVKLGYQKVATSVTELIEHQVPM